MADQDPERGAAPDDEPVPDSSSNGDATGDPGWLFPPLHEEANEEPPVPPRPGDDGVSVGDDRGRGQARSGGSFLRELPFLLLIALVLAFLLRTFVVQVFYIPSSSMEPTLQVDDRMIVEKVTYRFREPLRGEILVFEGDSFGEVDPDLSVGSRVVRGFGQFLGLVPASARDFVKRAIGLPGDEILIEDGVVMVNGVTLDEPYVAFEDPSDFGPVTVPDDSLFFLGDNRPNSSDSRRDLGFVDADKVVGRAVLIIWPFEHATTLTDVEHDLGVGVR
ncbi:MAG: signal peptidase I [Nitriliruptoraceae bacterium]